MGSGSSPGDAKPSHLFPYVLLPTEYELYFGPSLQNYIESYFQLSVVVFNVLQSLVSFGSDVCR